MRQILLWCVSYMLHHRIYCPLPSPNPFVRKKKDTLLLSFTLSSHSLYRTFRAISGYCRTLHSFKANKAKYIRVDLIHYYQYYHYTAFVAGKRKQDNTSRAQHYLSNKQPSQPSQPRQSISVTKRQADTFFAQSSHPHQTYTIASNNHPDCANPHSQRARTKRRKSPTTNYCAPPNLSRAQTTQQHPQNAPTTDPPPSLSPPPPHRHRPSSHQICNHNLHLHLHDNNHPHLRLQHPNLHLRNPHSQLPYHLRCPLNHHPRPPLLRLRPLRQLLPRLLQRSRPLPLPRRRGHRRPRPRRNGRRRQSDWHRRAHHARCAV